MVLTFLSSQTIIIFFLFHFTLNSFLVTKYSSGGSEIYLLRKKEFLKYSLVFCSVRLNEHSSTEELKCGPALLPLSYCTAAPAPSRPAGPVKRTRARAEDLATFVSPGFARHQTAERARFRRQKGRSFNKRLTNQRSEQEKMSARANGMARPTSKWLPRLPSS